MMIRRNLTKLRSLMCVREWRKFKIVFLVKFFYGHLERKRMCEHEWGVA